MKQRYAVPWPRCESGGGEPTVSLPERSTTQEAWGNRQRDPAEMHHEKPEVEGLPR